MHIFTRILVEPLIPPTLFGFSTDVIENEGVLPPILQEVDLRGDEDTKRYDPLQPGCSIVSVKPHGKDTAYLRGSLGPLARSMDTGDDLYLGCWHVLCAVPDWKKTDYNVY